MEKYDINCAKESLAAKYRRVRGPASSAILEFVKRILLTGSF
jgi:hypothetical protein